SVEKLDLRAIQNSPAVDFYSSLANLKGIDVATQGLLFKSINMRGFGATGNVRTVQLIDGMDNSAPGLNFPIDNIAGIPEQDVESVEILPGAASALYGPNAIQGLILMNSKSPFLYQGLSANVKTGVMSASNRATANTGFYDASIRYAKAFNNKFAFKLNLSYIQAKDWEASNYSNLNGGGNADPNRGAGTAPNYDGMNVYGDENQQNLQTVTSSIISNTATPANVRALLQGVTAGNLVPNTSISRTGYAERDLVDYDTKSLKINGALHYRITDKIEAIGQINYGFGTTVYTSNGRYSLRDFSLTQAKLELRGDNFTIRGYTTQERSGKSYTAGLASIFLNEAWKPSTSWYPQYAVAYAQARAGGQSDDAAHLAARAAADQGRPLPGTDAYNTYYEQVRNAPISSNTGGAFLDKSNLYHAEGVYNFKNQIKFADVLIGANIRQYQLGSEGTLFADQAEGRAGRININEYGAFAQVSKSLFDEHLKLTASTRYDKNQNFEGQFTPRVSAVATFGEHNIRLSYQTGFRIPTTQNQYIDLQTPQARLVG
ncbi:MAG: TonB-dependent receptor, partial [Cytophagaceae bacterium]